VNILLWFIWKVITNAVRIHIYETMWVKIKVAATLLLEIIHVNGALIL